MRTLIACLVGSCVAACGRSSLPYYRNTDMTPEWLGSSSASDPSMHRVASFRLVDQHGDAITNAAFGGRVSVVHFLFTSCRDVCPTTTRNLAALLRAMANDARVQVLSHSIAPASDSIGALREYAAARGIRDRRWHLLTGDSASIDSLARRSYFVRLGADTTYGKKSIAHTESVLLVDREGRLRGVYAGTLQLEMDRLRADVAMLLSEQR